MTIPRKKSPAIAVREVRQRLAAHGFPRTVVFVVFEEESQRLYEREQPR